MLPRASARRAPTLQTRDKERSQLAELCGTPVVKRMMKLFERKILKKAFGKKANSEQDGGCGCSPWWVSSGAYQHNSKYWADPWLRIRMSEVDDENENCLESLFVVNHRVPRVGRDPQGPSSSTSDSTQQRPHPKPG